MNETGEKKAVECVSETHTIAMFVSTHCQRNKSAVGAEQVYGFCKT